MEIKDLIIFLVIFVIVMWLQNNDDKKYKKNKRDSLFDIVKLPLFVSLLILIFKDFNCKVYDTFVEIIQMPDTTPIILNPLNQNICSDLNDIFIGPPDF